MGCSCIRTSPVLSSYGFLACFLMSCASVLPKSQPPDRESYIGSPESVDIVSRCRRIYLPCINRVNTVKLEAKYKEIVYNSLNEPTSSAARNQTSLISSHVFIFSPSPRGSPPESTAILQYLPPTVHLLSLKEPRTIQGDASHRLQWHRSSAYRTYTVRHF